MLVQEGSDNDVTRATRLSTVCAKALLLVNVHATTLNIYNYEPEFVAAFAFLLYVLKRSSRQSA